MAHCTPEGRCRCCIAKLRSVCSSQTVWYIKMQKVTKSFPGPAFLGGSRSQACDAGVASGVGAAGVTQACPQARIAGVTQACDSGVSSGVGAAGVTQACPQVSEKRCFADVSQRALGICPVGGCQMFRRSNNVVSPSRPPGKLFLRCDRQRREHSHRTKHTIQ